MAAERQVPGGPFVNEVGTAQRQIPGGPFINETVALAPSLPTITAMSPINVTGTTALQRFSRAA